MISEIGVLVVRMTRARMWFFIPISHFFLIHACSGQQKKNVAVRRENFNGFCSPHTLIKTDSRSVRGAWHVIRKNSTNAERNYKLGFKTLPFSKNRFRIRGKST